MPSSQMGVCTTPSSPCSGHKQPDTMVPSPRGRGSFRQQRKSLGVTKAAQGTLLEDVELALLGEVVKLCRRHHRQTPARTTPGACQGMQGCGEVEADHHEATRHPGELPQHTHPDVMTI